MRPVRSAVLFRKRRQFLRKSIRLIVQLSRVSLQFRDILVYTRRATRDEVLSLLQAIRLPSSRSYLPSLPMYLPAIL